MRACFLLLLPLLGLLVGTGAALAQSQPDTTTAADAVVVFNEIMYHPAGDNPALEWVELHNQMSVDIELSNWRIEGGIDFQFPVGTILPAGGYVVVAADPVALQAVSGITNVVGPFGRHLSNGGELLRLRNHNGRILDQMTSEDSAPWPVAADGSGASLAKRDKNSASSPAANWQSSPQIGGTPGQDNFPEIAASGPKTDLLINVGSPGRWRVPRDESQGQTWRLPGFDDAAWTSGSASVGFDAGLPAPTQWNNVALGAAVIAGSGAYPYESFNGGSFPAQRVTDGSSSDQFGVNYWLGREGQLNEYFILDLGRPVLLQEIRLRNTHNGGYNDRGTAHFQILAGQAIDANADLVSPQLVLDGTLRNVTSLDPIPTETFTATNGLVVSSARYLKFVALTANNPGNNVGLNELEVYAPSAPAVARAYALDGNVVDGSGNGLDGQNQGAQYSTNVPPAVGSGQSLRFDGVANQVQVPDPVNPTAYTLALWVCVETVRPCSLIVRTDGSGPDSSWSHQLRINSMGQFEHYLFDGVGRSVAATNVIQPGVWYHVVGTATSGGTMRIFVNGLSSGGAVSVGSLWAGGDQWRFGTDSGHTPNYFRGYLDEIGLWDIVLGEGEIQRLAAGTPAGLLNGYRGLILTDVEAALFRTNSSLLLRLPFIVPAGRSYDRLALQVQYDDGFVAFLNGTEVARRNAPQVLAWNAAATTNRSAAAVIHPESIDLSQFGGSLQSGSNVLAFHALNAAPADPVFLLTAQLAATQALPSGGPASLAFNEVESADSPSFFLELLNYGTTNLALDGCGILSSAGARRFSFGAQTLGPGSLLRLDTNDLGFVVQAGDKLFLMGKNQTVLEGVQVQQRLLGKLPANPTGTWLFPAAPTPGLTNRFALHDEVVINEIMYHHPPAYTTNAVPPAMVEDEEQWIELYNRSRNSVDLSGWQLEDAVSFTFPSNCSLAADGYVVIANNAAAVRARYPGITVLGDFRGKLLHRGAQVRLSDAQQNPVNEVTYYDDFPWPGYADGGGSSLELGDPRADNSVPESWAASREDTKTSWRHYSYRTRAINPVYSPAIYSFHEFRLGLLSEGEALLDNITVRELPTNGPPRQLLQNTNFSAGLARWRATGNHVHSYVEPDPAGAGNPVLHLVAAGPMSYLENQLESTLKADGALVPVVAGRDYEVAFDAKWVAGSPQLHSELYYNKVAATTLLDRPEAFGTPGRRNSTCVADAGPTFRGLRHSPVVPTSGSAIQVSVQANDPDGVAGLTLHYAVNGGSWQTVAMALLSDSSITYVGTIPAQLSGTVIQFYVAGLDSLGAASTYPADGTNSRALIQVDATRIVPGKQTVRTIMTPADAALLHSFVNLMSDDPLRCTVLHDEQEVFYDARIRLHGSMFSRTDPANSGFTVKFPHDHLFRGSRASIVVRRGNLVETIGKHILNQAGGLPANYNDVVYLVSHRTDNRGTATLNLANYDDTYVDSQFELNNDGTVFKLEGIRVYQTTDDGTPEGYKLPQPVDFVWDYDITNLGDDPEQYRWSFLIQSRRARDDFSPIVAMGKAFGLSGTARQQAVAAAIDVDEWARYFALQTLVGVGDIYGVDNPHNIAFYARPDDGRVLVLQNDWGYAFGLYTGASIYGKSKVYEILGLPVYRRLYQGHLLDLMNSVYNSAYLTRWAQHFTKVTGADFSSVPGYAEARNAAVRSQLAAQIPFAITSNGGNDFTVNTPVVTLEGRAWINVHGIGRAGQTNLLPITWLDDQRWQVQLPLAQGANLIQLVAYDYQGAMVGQDAITVTTTLLGFTQRDYLRITEVMYHPPAPSASELAAGFSDREDFEFIELMNTGPANVSLAGVRFALGVTFDFTGSAVTNLAPAQRVMVVAKRSAFAWRYGTNCLVAGPFTGHLDNGGELVRLIDSFGNIIQEFAYDDNGSWSAAADGEGSSLEVLNVNGDYNSPANWQASVAQGGTPGQRPIIRPAFLSGTREGSQVYLRFQAVPDQSYTLYVRDSLTASQWTPLATIPAGASTRIEEVVDSPPTEAAQRFYRLATP